MAGANKLYKSPREEYSDIIDLPHHVSTKHIPMSMRDRAAQFSSFAALVGYKEELNEIVRRVDKKKELDEDEINRLNLKIQILRDCIADGPEVMITHFVPDLEKAGGKYVTTTDTVKKIDEINMKITLESGKSIEINNLYDIDGEIFKMI